MLPIEPKEIKPHPYGIELGMLVAMLKDTKTATLAQFLTTSFSRVSQSVAAKICETAKLSTRANPHKIGRHEADKLYQCDHGHQDRHAGDRLHLADRRSPTAQGAAPGRAGRILRGQHPAAGGLSRQSVSDRGGAWPMAARRRRTRSRSETLTELLAESDARTLRQFLTTTFYGLGSDAADKILKQAELGTRASPGKLKTAEIAKLHEARTA